MKIAIIGLGFMGGSLGLAIKRFIPEVSVYGVGHSSSQVEEARKAGAIDEGGVDLDLGAKGAEFVFIATPIESIITLVKKLKGKIDPETIVTDLGSTKTEICQAARESIPRQFVGGHPMAGSEIQGIKGADPLLFQNAIYILTPLAAGANEKTLAKFLEKLGCGVVSVSPELHDQVTAYVSHLPQLLAVSLTHLIFEKNKKEPLFKTLAAGGFRDMTRIASSPFKIWEDILKTNALRIREAADDLLESLQAIKNKLNQPSMSAAFDESGKFRNELPVRSKGFITPLHRILVSVSDEKGILAKITRTVSDENINIRDIELLKVREGVGGTFHLYFGSGEDAEKAAQALRLAGFQSRVID